MDTKYISSLIRPNILSLQAYSSARSEFKSESEIFLDANENPYSSAFNRYPDPTQKALKAKIAKWRNLNVDQLFLGNGSDEIIDLIIRIFCKPGQDNIVTFNPTYGMYKVCAGINDVNVRCFDLEEGFGFRVQGLIDFLMPNDKVLFICSPNNPTGNSIRLEDIVTIGRNFHGIIVVDEAYIDFSEQQSCTVLLDDMPQLIVLQTLSKAVGCAGLRIGIAWMHTDLVKIFNKVKPPYNISNIGQDMAIDKLNDLSKINREIQDIKAQRSFLADQLSKCQSIIKVYPSDGNFLLLKCHDAKKIYHYLISNGIVVRDRSSQNRCDNALRITVGTPTQNQKLIDVLTKYNPENIT